MSKKKKQTNGRQSVDAIVKSICDIMRRGNMAGALQYVPELTWILFLRILDEIEEQERTESEAVSGDWSPALEKPFRWRDWAAPDGKKRIALTESAAGDFLQFVNGELLSHLKGLRDNAGASVKQKVISEILSGVDKVGMDTERNFLDVLDKVDALRQESVDPTHVFTLSQVYEGLLLKMGEKNNDGGQFFTPREVIRAMVRVVDPKLDETVFDPCCGTGGFLAQAYEHIWNANKQAAATQLENLKERTFYGREKENLIYPVALANLVLHGIDHPRIWHGNTLTRQADYDGLFEGAPSFFNVVLTNPPFGGKEGSEAQTRYDYQTNSTQVLFLQEVVKSLKEDGRCGMVVDEGLLFRTNETAFVKTKRYLSEECNLWCVLSLPGGVFTQAGAGVKTNLLFFTKGERTGKIWYYDLSEVKVTKRQPLTLSHFDEFFRLLPERAESENSWTVDLRGRIQEAGEEARPFRQKAGEKGRERTRIEKRLTRLRRQRENKDQAAIEETQAALSALKKEISTLQKQATDIENAAYDLKAVNPNKQPEMDTRTPDELLDIIAAKGQEIREALKTLS